MRTARTLLEDDSDGLAIFEIGRGADSDVACHRALESIGQAGVDRYGSG